MNGFTLHRKGKDDCSTVRREYLRVPRLFFSVFQTTMAQQYLSNPIGSYSDRKEFQVGRVIVWVEIPSHGSRAAWLKQANLIFESVWRDVPAAVSAAHQVSRSPILESWNAHDEAGTASDQLSVWGIWIDPTSGSADYEVGLNHDFSCGGSTNLPEPPDDYSVIVSRDPHGGMSVHGGRFGP
jgi:hypothetical protein